MNINSIRNKSEPLKNLINNNFDIFMILISSETIDETFPDAKMCIDVYSGCYHFDQNFNVGGFFLYATEDIPSKMITADLQGTFTGFFIEINSVKKWTS